MLTIKQRNVVCRSIHGPRRVRIQGGCSRCYCQGLTLPPPLGPCNIFDVSPLPPFLLRNNLRDCATTSHTAPADLTLLYVGRYRTGGGPETAGSVHGGWYLAELTLVLVRPWSRLTRVCIPRLSARSSPTSLPATPVSLFSPSPRACLPVCSYKCLPYSCFYL